MNTTTYFSDLGLQDYQKVWDRQESIFNELLQIKSMNHDLPQCEQIHGFQHLIFCEHPHVYTLGKSGDEQNLLINNIELKTKDVQFVKTNRGGDITYHGPEQLVGYPILDLEILNIGVKEYIFKLEEAIIRTIAEYGLTGNRVDSAIGVWLDAEAGKPQRKICAIGVKVSRHITMHGFALNINTNLNYFNHINPCGFVDKSVTSLENELSRKLDKEEVKQKVKNHLKDVFELEFDSEV